MSALIRVKEFHLGFAITQKGTAKVRLVAADKNKHDSNTRSILQAAFTLSMPVLPGKPGWRRD